jgi:hypothetical protein
MDDLPDVARAIEARAIEGGAVKQLDHSDPVCNTKLTKRRLFKWLKHVLALYYKTSHHKQLILDVFEAPIILISVLAVIKEVLQAASGTSL